MAQDDAIADGGWIPGSHMEHAAILDAGPRSDPDRPKIASKNRARPEAALGSDGDLANYGGFWVDEGRGVNIGLFAADFVDCHVTRVGVAKDTRRF